MRRFQWSWCERLRWSNWISYPFPESAGCLLYPKDWSCADEMKTEPFPRIAEIVHGHLGWISGCSWPALHCSFKHFSHEFRSISYTYTDESLPFPVLFEITCRQFFLFMFCPWTWHSLLQISVAFWLKFIIIVQAKTLEGTCIVAIAQTAQLLSYKKPLISSQFFIHSKDLFYFIAWVFRKLIYEMN
jgi:hypothetical protein